MQQFRTFSPRSFTLLALGALMATLGACSGPGTTTSSHTSTTRDSPGSPPPNAYKTFDVVWSTVDQRHFDPDHNGVDWVAIREEYRPKIEETRSDAEVRSVLQQMLSELGQSHFVIIPESISDSSDSDLGFPLGNAVLKLPVNLIARGYSLSESLKFWTICSGLN